MVSGGFHGDETILSDIEALRLDEDGTNCDPTDLPYQVAFHASVHTPPLDGAVTCGGRDKNEIYLSKCILQRRGDDSIHFPSLRLKRAWFSLTSISDKIYAIGGYPNENTMETINLHTDRQWKKEEMPLLVSGTLFTRTRKQHHCNWRTGWKLQCK